MIEGTREAQMTLGEITIARVVEMEGPMMRPQDLLPAATAEMLDLHRAWLEPHYLSPSNILIMSIQSFVVRTSQRTILVDTCVGNDKQRDNPSWTNLQLPYLQDLKAAGFSPEDIDVVLCTHMHLDHVGWNTKLKNGRWVPTFPNARYLFTQIEWDFWKERPPDQSYNHPCIDDSVLPVIESGQAEFVKGDYGISEQAWLEFAPGHTPGHVTLHLESEGGEAILAGDIFHHPVQVAEPQLRAEYLDVDANAAEATRISFLKRYADSEVLVFGSHFAYPSGGYIRTDGESLRLLAGVSD